MDNHDRVFYSTLSLIGGGVAMLLGWVAAITLVGALLIPAGLVGVIIGLALRPTRRRFAAATVALGLGLWPLTITTWAL